MLPPYKIKYDVIKQKPLHLFNEERFNTLTNDMLNESLGSFEEQYQI